MMDSFLTLSFTVISGILLLVYFYVKLIHFTYWKRHGIYQLPQTFPTGMAWPLIKGQHIGDMLRDVYLKIRSEHRTNAGFYLLSKPQLMLTDPEDIKHLLTTDFQHFQNRGLWSNEVVDPLSINLLSVPGHRWKYVRAKLSPFFTPSNLRNLFPIMKELGEDLVQVVEEYADKNMCLDIKEVNLRFASTVLATCLFSFKCNSLKDPNDISNVVGKDIFNSGVWQNFTRNCFFLMPEILGWFRISSNSPLVTDFFMNLTTDTIKYRKKNNTKSNDFLQLLINLKKNGQDDKDGLSINEIAAQCWAFFAGGFDPSASLVMFCMFELSRNQKIQNKVRKEVLKELKNHNGEFTYQMLNNMKYMEKVVKEVERKYPALPFLTRQCTSEEYTFKNSNITVRKGDAIVLSLYGLQRDPEYFPDPDKFDPERFNDENNIISYSYLPFGEGPRNCIATRMGMLQGKYTIALLVSNFKFYFNERTKLPLVMEKNSFAFTAEGGIWLNVQRV